MKYKTMRTLVGFLIALSFYACTTKNTELKTGIWRGVLKMQKHELPFLLEIQKKDSSYIGYLINGEEKILLKDISLNGNSVLIRLHIFDAALDAKIEGNTLHGMMRKYYAQKENLPFYATFNDNYRFTKDTIKTLDFSGKYQVTFFNSTDTIKSIGLLNQKSNTITGSFVALSGDFRFLEGNVIDNQLFLSTFDGNHAYIISANKRGDTLTGNFFSGNDEHYRWIGIKSENPQLPDPEKITFAKDSNARFEFSYFDLNKNLISNTDARFKNKVTIIQIFGSWCPNSMDQTEFLSSWYEENKGRDIEVLGLAYERKDDFNYAKNLLENLINNYDIHYPIVIAGVNDKEKISKTLPILNKISYIPTLVVLDKNGKVSFVHAGFSGPATGEYYLRFQDRFNQKVNELLAEKSAL